MSLTVETASRKMFDWFVKESSMTTLFKNKEVCAIVWNICASQFYEIFEEGLRLNPQQIEDDNNDEDDEDMDVIANRFYSIVVGLIWINDKEGCDLTYRFKKYLLQIR